MKKVLAPKALDAARLGPIQAGAVVANNPIYKPQPDPWNPIFINPIVIVVTPVGY